MRSKQSQTKILVKIGIEKHQLDYWILFSESKFDSNIFSHYSECRSSSMSNLIAFLPSFHSSTILKNTQLFHILLAGGNPLQTKCYTEGTSICIHIKYMQLLAGNASEYIYDHVCLFTWNYKLISITRSITPARNWDSDITSQFYSLHQNIFTKAAGKNLQDLT